MKKNASRTSDESVKKATGKSWSDWFKILDAKKMDLKPHKEIASWLHGNHEISGWWSQMVTVEYEKERGLREDYQKPGGYEISSGRQSMFLLMSFSVFFADKVKRRKWLKEKMEISTATPNKSLRALWIDDGTRISVNFYPKSESKCQVTVQHLKLRDKSSADSRKKFWSERLSQLKDLAEG